MPGFFSEVIPAALTLLEPEHAYRLRLTLQARPEDAGMARSTLSRLQVEARVEEFFSDLPNQIAHSHLVICRSGASSVSEIALIGRPSILVPLPGALDDDQGGKCEASGKRGWRFSDQAERINPGKTSNNAQKCHVSARYTCNTGGKRQKGRQTGCSPTAC